MCDPETKRRKATWFSQKKVRMEKSQMSIKIIGLQYYEEQSKVLNRALGFRGNSF
jgi:hypothetical protein